jgi:hypothetical protein
MSTTEHLYNLFILDRGEPRRQMEHARILDSSLSLTVSATPRSLVAPVPPRRPHPATDAARARPRRPRPLASGRRLRIQLSGAANGRRGLIGGATTGESPLQVRRGSGAGDQKGGRGAPVQADGADTETQYRDSVGREVEQQMQTRAESKLERSLLSVRDNLTD